MTRILIPLPHRLQEWLNVLQSLLLSFSLLPVLHFTSSSKIMGPYKSSAPVAAVVWLLALAVLAINIYLVVSRIGPGQPWWAYAFASLAGIVYLAFSYHLVRDDVSAGYRALFNLLPEPLQRCLSTPSASSSEGAGGGGAAAAPAASLSIPGSPDVKQQLANPLIQEGETAS